MSLEKLREGIELRYESENINFTLALTKCAFLRFHLVRGLAVELESVATRGARARASTRLACAHPRLHNRPPTPRPARPARDPPPPLRGPHNPRARCTTHAK